MAEQKEDRGLARSSLHKEQTAVADKQCGGLQTRVDVGALPTRRAKPLHVVLDR